MSGRSAGLQTGGQAARAGSGFAFRPTGSGRPEQKGEIMPPDYSKQRVALISLSVAYEGARDFTRRVLQTAFGDPPPDKCEWPPAAITPTEAHSRLKAVQGFLQQTKGVFRKVLRNIKDAQVALVASGFDAPRSWIITDPLDKIKGGYLGTCGVDEIVKSAAAEDSVLETVLNEIAVNLVLLEGRIAEAHQVTTPTGKKGGEPNRYAALDKLKPAHRKAWFSFVYAEAKSKRRLEDRDAYNWIEENGIDPDEEQSGELVDYKLPSFETWDRYLREARKATGEQKYTPRRGRETGRSVVKGSKIEQQHPADD